MRRLVLIIFVISISLFTLMTLSETTAFTIPFSYLSKISPSLTASTVQNVPVTFDFPALFMILILASILLSGVYVHYHRIMQKENHLPSYDSPPEQRHGNIIHKLALRPRAQTPAKKNTVIIPLETSAYTDELKTINEQLTRLPATNRVDKTDLLRQLNEIEAQLHKTK